VARVPKHSSELELQDQLMRFEGRFSARLVAAFEPFSQSKDPAARSRAARDLLEFMASALDIAVGRSPEVDLLDMVALVALGRTAMSRRYGSGAHGAMGLSVVDAFQTSLDDIDGIARAAFSDDLEAGVRQAIIEWEEENPEVMDVASVRLSAHADNVTGTSTRSAKHAAGLFSFVRRATYAADNVVLLGERALYVAQRLPFHLRFHARIATNDLVTDATRSILDVSRDAELRRATTSLASTVRRGAKSALWSAAAACGALALAFTMMKLVTWRITTTRA
jgi:hypothetical protein